MVTGVGFFLAAIAPTPVVAGHSPSIASDKYAYLPMIGVLLPVAALARRASVTSQVQAEALGLLQGRMRALATIGLALGAWAGLAAATHKRAGHWADTESLNRHLLGLYPDVPALHNDLAITLLEKGRSQEAMEHLRRALALDAHDPRTRVNLGHALLRTGDAHAAAEQL